MLEVTVHLTDGSEKSFVFDKSSVMVGRGAGNDVHLEIGGVSRYHSRLSVDGERVIVEDLNSTNGTFLNSEKVQIGDVSPADRITVGDAVITARIIGSPVAEEELPPAVSGPSQTFMGKISFGGEASSEAENKSVPSGAAEVKEDEDEGSGVNDSFYWRSLKSFLAPIWPYIIDDSISEIMVNGPTEIYIESKGKLSQTDAKFTEDQLKAAVINIAQYVGRRATEEEPYLDARLPDGSRVAVLLPPCSRKGISIAIRKFAKEKLTLDKLLGFGSISQEMITFLSAAVVLKKNIIVSGGTSSGKTSLLNLVTGLIPNDERIITIEDSAELQLTQEHVLPMETKPPDKKGRGQITIRDLVKASLRMRPDRIVVGEIRGGEALDLLQAMNTGHSGSMTTLHASSPLQALTRLETLALFSGLEIPMRALRDQVASAVEIVVQAARLPDHSRKVTHISEVGKLKEDGTYEMHDIFRFNRTATVDGKIKGSHIWTGYVPTLIDEMELAGLTDAVKLFNKEHSRS